MFKFGNYGPRASINVSDTVTEAVHWTLWDIHSRCGVKEGRAKS